MDRRDLQGVALLPDDVLADVLCRVPPRGLAACRCVCKAWLAVVDARHLLRADLLPLSLGGLFINFHNYYISEFFAPLSDGPCIISGKHDYLHEEAASASWGYVDDHCNGLVLGQDSNVDERGYVLNPATRWLARLPPRPPPPMEIKDTFQVEYLAYDPIDSPYFEVVSVTRFRWMREPQPEGLLCYDSFRDALDPEVEQFEWPPPEDFFSYDSSRDALDPEIEQSEWPPSVYILPVFSSRTGQWEERSFAREGDSMGTVSAMRYCPGDQRNAVYWRGALYVHCQTDYVMRISLSGDKYHVIKPPPGIETDPGFYLGKTSKGVCCASIQRRCRVQVWNLDESGCQMEWVLKHDRDLSKWLLKHKLERPHPSYDRKIQGPWALQDINYYYINRDRENGMEAPAEEEVEWTLQAPEDEVFTWSSDDDEWRYYSGYMEILGFHPCKEIIFLSESITRGLAYHLNTSKVEVLGNIYPAGYHNALPNELLESSFPYTPCWITHPADDGE